MNLFDSHDNNVSTYVIFFFLKLLFNRIIMAILIESFRVMTYTGVWNPFEQYDWKSYIYNLYTIIVLFLNFGFTFAEALDLIFICRNKQQIIDTTFLLITMITVCVKFYGIVAWRKDIKKILESFHSDWLKPNTSDEIEIEIKYNRLIRIYCLFSIVLYEITGLSIIIGGMCTDLNEYELPFRNMLSYDYSTPIIYRLTVILQIFVIFDAASFVGGFDTMLFGILIQICGRIDILKKRFQVAVITLEEIYNKTSYNWEYYRKMEDKFFSDWIKSHNAVLSFCELIESLFTAIIFVQYSMSSFALCSIIYLLSQLPIISIEFLTSFCYLICMSSAIFLMCTFANQVTLKFADLSRVMYDTNWLILSIPAKKKIIFMMAKTSKPVLFTSGHMVTLSLESFKALLKVIYSTYSLLSST